MLLHLMLLFAMVYHAWIWFYILPKTMPMMFGGGQRVAAATITRFGLAAAVIASLAVFALAWAWRP
jgi:fumarate reductase subunit C